MSRPLKRKLNDPSDWNAIYYSGVPPWDSGKLSEELVRVLDEQQFRTGPVLELGCGTGANAVCLAQRGFEVTALDCSPIAIERARQRAEQQNALINFVMGDAFEFAKTVDHFDLIFDVGFYHSIRKTLLSKHLDLLWRLTNPGSHYLALVGSDQETAEGGPPRVSESEIRNELGRLFEFVHIRPFRFDSPARPEGYLGWSCLMRRPEKIST